MTTRRHYASSDVQRVKDLRKTRSLRQISEELGIPKSTVSAWLSGSRCPAPQSPKRRSHSPATVAKVVGMWRDDRMGPKAIRDATGISASTIRKWLSQQPCRKDVEPFSEAELTLAQKIFNDIGISIPTALGWISRSPNRKRLTEDRSGRCDKASLS